MEHPELDVEQIKKLTMEEIQSKIYNLNKKLSFSYTTGNQALINQLRMALESYMRAQTEKLNEMFVSYNEDGKDIGKIDIS